MGQKREVSDHRKPNVAALGELLRVRRETAGLSLNQMALKLGISRPYLGRLESGECEHPAPAKLSKMARCLDVPLEDLYALAGITPPTDLPDLCPYLRAKHPDWPELAITELNDFCDFLKHKYSLR
jgi:transcriptional regulator with XRE-family HTH domain